MNKRGLQTLLIRSAVKTMLRNRRETLFTQLPLELIRVIKYSPTPDRDFLDALHEAAFGKLNELKSRLEIAKSDKTALGWREFYAAVTAELARRKAAVRLSR
jgi:hypothetical protein